MASIDTGSLSLSATQGGVLSPTQVRELGYTRRQVDYRISTSQWRPIGNLGYRVLPSRDHIDLVRAAVALLPEAVVSHETACELHRIGRVRTGMAVVSVHTRTTHAFPGVVVRRCHDMLDEHLTTISGLPVTTIPRALADMARLIHWRHLASITDDLVAAGRLDLAELAGVASTVGRRGRPGTTNLRMVLDERLGEKHPTSELERRGRRLLASAGLPAPLAEHPVPWAPHRRFDDAYPGARLAIEWDSRRYHGQRDAFEADRARDREAVLRGWVVLRFTWLDVTTHPGLVIETVRSALVARSVG